MWARRTHKTKQTKKQDEHVFIVILIIIIPILQWEVVIFDEYSYSAGRKSNFFVVTNPVLGSHIYSSGRYTKLEPSTVKSSE